MMVTIITYYLIVVLESRRIGHLFSSLTHRKMQEKKEEETIIKQRERERAQSSYLVTWTRALTFSPSLSLSPPLHCSILLVVNLLSVSNLHIHSNRTFSVLRHIKWSARDERWNGHNAHIHSLVPVPVCVITCVKVRRKAQEKAFFARDSSM